MSTTRPTRAALQARISAWNSRYPVGTPVIARNDMDRIHKTRSTAQLLFDKRAAVYLEGFGGYFELDDLHPADEPVGARSVAVVFPGQGSQSLGMGRDLFASFPREVSRASQILGYSIERLCLTDPDRQLDQTQYTQVAVYVVNALGFLRYRGRQADSAEVTDQGSSARADFLLGHSLGEYNALLAAGVFDFESGLRLVKKRGELSAAVRGGAMAAVLGCPPQRIRELLERHGLDTVDLANLNTPTQTVISGPVDAITSAIALFAANDITAAALKVSAAFHSRQMRAAQAEFLDYLRQFELRPPTVPVIANATALPYEPQRMAETLAAQLASPVRWVESIEYLLGRGAVEFREIGGSVLTRMVRQIAPGIPASQATSA